MLNIFNILLSKDIYNKYKDSIIDILPKDNKELSLLYKYLVELHERYTTDIVFTDFYMYVLSRVQEKDKEVFQHLLQQIQDQDPSPVVEDILVDLKQKQISYDLAIKALEASEGRLTYEELCGYTNEHLNATAALPATSTSFVTDDLDELLNTSGQNTGLRWRLQALNQMLGSLRKGNFGFIFARPETGKTTFLASEVSHFAGQTDRPILWVNNEEDGAAVKLRIYQATLGCTLTELRVFPDESFRKYHELGGGNIKVLDSATTHRRQIERLCKELNPALVVFDQIDKIKGFDGDREDLRLGGIYIWARELAKEYCPVIGVSQADVSGEGKKWLTMENVANAKTAKQSEADWILGIGHTHNDTEAFDRFLHLSKNKLIGDVDTMPELRHGKATVKIIPDVARYGDY